MPGLCWKKPLGFCAAGWNAGGVNRRRKTVSALLAVVLMLLSACSTLPQRKNELQPRPILPSMERMSRGDQPGVWMDDGDAANLALWVEHVEQICR